MARVLCAAASGEPFVLDCSSEHACRTMRTTVSGPDCVSRPVVLDNVHANWIGQALQIAADRRGLTVVTCAEASPFLFAEVRIAMGGLDAAGSSSQMLVTGPLR